ncbi:hypothetical protein HRbin16_01776 [bacterium HR16]|nr:hypothetical protein HRbin16_01776 [bacterium HR16]
MSVRAKALTVRLPEDLYRASAEVAKRRKVSLNSLVREGLNIILREERYVRMYEAFGLVGEDASMTDVEFAVDAQREVVEHGDA